MFVPAMRELRETWHQFVHPWVTDATRTEAALGISATPIEEGAAATVGWWRSRLDG